MKNNQIRRILAICLSGAMLAGAATAAGAYENHVALTAQEEEVDLAIAGAQDEEAAEATEADPALEDETEAAEPKAEEAVEAEPETDEETETEPETEEIVYETLETTATGEIAVSAIDVSNVVENTMPSIVSITLKSVQEVESYFYGRREIELEGAGSGIIIAQNSSELLIATNNHVVSDATELTICFSAEAEDPDDLVAKAVVKGTSSKYDLAVVAVKLSDISPAVLSQLKIATLGSSDNLKVGETAIVIGNALGVGQTVTTGIISALEREIMTDAGTFTELQTDAAVNFGCSGGAILNAKGEVIAITSAKATSDNAESMGYGIPIDTAIPVLKDLINRQTREAVQNRGYMGISVYPVSDEAKEMYNMPAGAFVAEVTPGSGAEAAGIQKGDIVTKFDGIEITSSDDLVATLDYYEVGETVVVEVQTAEGGAYVAREVEVVLQEGAAQEESEAPAQERPQGDDRQEDDDWGWQKDDDWGEDRIPRDQDGESYNGAPGYGYGWEDFFNQFGFGF